MRWTISIFALALVFAGLHTYIGLSQGGELLVPFAMAALGACILAGLHSQKILMTQLLDIFYLSVAILLFSMISSIQYGEFSQHLVSSTLLIYAIVLSYFVYIGISQINDKRIEAFFLTGLLLLIAGCYLEIYGGLKPVSDAFRQFAFSWQRGSLYADTNRDVLQYGGIRPNFFASEPSIVGITAGYFILFWFFAGSVYTVRRLTWATALALSAFLIIRSPTIFVCLAICFLMFFVEFKTGQKVSRSRVMVVGGVSLFFIVALPFVISMLSDYGRSGSFFLRELGPPLIVMDVLKHSPFWGVGLGGHAGLMQSVLSAYSSPSGFGSNVDILRSFLRGRLNSNGLMSNEFYEYWASFGLAGGYVVLALIWKILGGLKTPNRTLILLIVAPIFTLSGGINNPPSWVALFTICQLYKRHWAHREHELAAAISAETLPAGSTGSNQVPVPVWRGSKAVLMVIGAVLLAAAGRPVQAEPKEDASACGSLSGDHLGVNVTNLSFAALQSPNLIRAIQQSGVQWVRINLYWGWTEQYEDRFDWAAADSTLRLLQADHIHVLLVIGGPVPCWALATRMNDCKTPQWGLPDSVKWQQFVGTAVGRYHNLVGYWEIWNEPDLEDGLQVHNDQARLVSYRDGILTPAARAIHSVDPTAKVVAPALAATWGAHSSPGKDMQAVLALLMLHQGVNVDIVSVHDYSPFDVRAMVQSVHAALAQDNIVSKPIWVTELGLTEKDDDVAASGYANQTSFLQRELVGSVASGSVAKVFWYALTDSPNEQGQHTDHYGLIDNLNYQSYPWRPRATYQALQRLTGADCGQ